MKVDNPLTVRRVAAIEAATTGRMLSARELGSAIHICHQSALRYVRHLLGDNPDVGAQMHVGGWRDIGPGKRVPLYLWGPGPHAPKPVPQTRVEAVREYRKRVRKDPVRNALYLARQRARDRADRAAKRPQGWAAALLGPVRRGRASHA
jgi:hypothetical protein